MNKQTFSMLLLKRGSRSSKYVGRKPGRHTNKILLILQGRYICPKKKSFFMLTYFSLTTMNTLTGKTKP